LGGTILAKNIENNADSADLRAIFISERKPVKAGSVPDFKR
jgi:hypothetical protein